MDVPLQTPGASRCYGRANELRSKYIVLKGGDLWAKIKKTKRTYGSRPERDDEINRRT